MSLHARFSASSSHRWMRCPGSVRLTEGIESADSEWSAEGSFLHEVAAELLLDWPQQHQLTEEQQDVVDQYVNLVRAEREGGMLFVETKFRLPFHREMWGTADAVVVRDKHLKVFDFKAGRGVGVFPDYRGKINPQLGFYALGAMAALNRRDWDTIEVIIVQPRFGGVKRRATTVQELDDLGLELVDAAKKADRKRPPFAAGNWCKFCLAKGFCATLRQDVFEIVGMAA